MFEHAMWMYPMTISKTQVVYLFSASSAWGDIFGQTISQLVGLAMSLLISLVWLGISGHQAFIIFIKPENL